MTYLTRQFDAADSDGGRGPDELAVEEPLQIRLDGALVATTMRTPGNDFELAVGWCHAEGMLAGSDVQSVRYCGTGSAVDTFFNVVSVSTGRPPRALSARLGTTSSSCGLCGSVAIDELVDRIAPLSNPEVFPPAVLAQVPERMRSHQPLFDATGAVHAAAAFEADGVLLVVREDIGRHNAVDKVVGSLLLERPSPGHPRRDSVTPASGMGLAVSGRASFEILQKAWAAGFSAVVAVSAPSALAVEVARRAGITLAGFARNDGLRIYAGPQLP